MSRRTLLQVGLVFVMLVAMLAEMLPAPAIAQAREASAPVMPTDTPETFHTDPESGIFHLTLKDNLLYYHSPCGGEFAPARSRVRSLPTSGGPMRNLYYPAACPSDYVQSTNVAVDNEYVYWLTFNGKVVRLPRGASASDTPQIVANMAAAGTMISWIAVDSAQVYWSEGSILYRAPKDGSGSRTTVFNYASTYGAGNISQLVADGSGAVYLLYANTVFRDRITATETPVSPIGRGQGLTLGNNKVYWAEKDASTSTVYLKSATMLTPTTGLANLTTINGTGNPAVTYLTVDSTNLFWHEERSNAGPLQRMANTGGPVGSIVSNMGTPLSLVTTGRYVYWNDFDNIYRLSTAAAAITIDFTGSERPIEVIQTVQSGTGSVTELVRGKETFVRVYGRIASSSAGLTSIADLRPAALLRGFQGATELPGSPLLPTNFSTPLGSAPTDRTQLNSSFWFRLPPAWISGTITLRGEVNPNRSYVETTYLNNVSQRTVTFAPKAPICLDLVPVATVRGTTIASFNPDRDDRSFFERARSLLPTNELRVFYRGGPRLTKPRWYLWDSDPYSLSDSDDDSGWLLFWSNVRYLFGDDPGGCGAVNANTIRVTMAPDHPARPLNGIQGGNSLLYFTFRDASGGFTVNVPGGGTTLAHEIGHAYGRGHVNCPNGEPAGVDGGYPYPACQLDNAGANSHLGYDRITNQLLLPADTGDLMSYAHFLPKPRWTSDYTWRAIYNALGNSPSLTQSDRPLRPDAPSLTLIVAGVFSSTGAYVGPAYQVTGALETNAIDRIVASTQPTTTYEVRVYDAGNTVIGSAPLRIYESADEAGNSTTRAFMNWVFYSSENTPTRIAVVRLSDNAAVGSITAGANPPTVTITSPTGGSFTTGLTASWTGSDPDGDTVLYTVRYSADNGATWIALATALHANQLSVPLNDGLPGGAQARLQVLATDGMHTAVATSAPFSVALHAPQAAIFDDGGHLLNTVMITAAQQSDIVVLNGQAYDAEDGPLNGSALQWNVTGPINQTGSGTQLTLFNLPPATYGVRLTATDSHGLTATTTTSVTIAPKHVFDGATPTLDGDCTDSGYDSELDPITLRYTGIISAAQVHFAHTDGALWACFSGLQIGAVANSFAGIRADVDNSGGAFATSSDLGFFVGRDGVPFTVHGDGVGGFPVDAVPNGLTAAVSQDVASGLWNAELRIDESKVGGWNHLVRLKVSHYWRNFGGDDTVWPAGSFYNVPNTWGLTSLGRLNQAVTFDPIANHGRTDPAFAVTASASSGLPVSFESLTPGVCTILGNQATLNGVGTCTLRASQPGNATYFAATAVTRSFTVFSKVYLPVVIR
jgi:hypothetical protein